MPDLPERIYEAIFFPGLWDGILHDMAAAAEAEGALLANLSGSWIASPGVADLYDDFFAEGWAYENAKTKALLGISHQGFISDADHFSDSWMAEQPVYRDFFWKHGFGYAAGTVIEAPSGDVIAISIEKKKGERPVARDGLERLDALRPHLARATTMASRLAFRQVQTALDTLDMTGLPAAMIRDDGRVIACNALMEALSAQIVIRSGDRLSFRNKAAAAFFETIIGRYRSVRADQVEAGLSFPVPASEGCVAAVIHVVPVAGAARDIFARTAFLVVVTPVVPRTVPSAAVIKGLFDLTPAEARIAHRLAGGASVRNAASEFGLSVETVRSQVKAVLAKSGMTRQSDFVAAVSTLQTFPTE